MTATPNAQPPSPLGAILASTSRGMLNKLEEIRAGLSHAGEKGNAAEEIVSQFLNERLPMSIRATTGQVMDRRGGMSGQVDVILYDATRTPMLFASSNGGRHTVPAEGVLAVVEVKTRLTRAEVSKSIKHAATVKTLTRDAFIQSPRPIGFDAYGSIWAPLPPILYSVFAFEGDGLYSDILNSSPHHDLPPEHRIDNMIVLNVGICLAGDLIPTTPGEVPETEYRFLVSPTPGTVMFDCEAQNPLATWFALMTGQLSQLVGSGIVDVTRYVLAETALAGQYDPRTPGGQAMHARVKQDHANALELPVELLDRYASGGAMTWSEMHDILSHPRSVPTDLPTDMHPARAARLRQINAAAKWMPKDRWVEWVTSIPAPDWPDAEPS